MRYLAKIFMLVILAIAFSTSQVNAQLTTVEPSAKKIKGGNRVEAGDFGIYMGLTSDMFKGWFDKGLKITALPLVNFKYMATDRMEVRLGAEFYKESTKASGDKLIDDTTSEPNSSSSIDSRNYFYPGFAYHFTPKNLLDVYVGAEMPIGWSRDSDKTLDANVSKSATKASFDIGLGAFVGLQAYIADLPFAIGVEYGISGLFQTCLKYKYEMIDADSQKTIYYTKDPAVFQSNTDIYSDLKAKKGEVGQQFRVTFTYYFKR